MNYQLRVNVHGVKAIIESDNSEFIDFTKENYIFFENTIEEQPNLNIKFSPEYESLFNQLKIQLNRYGEGLYLNNEYLYWENEYGFKIAIKFIEKSSWEIYGYHFDLLNDQNEEEKLKNFTRSMRWMIHFPIFLMQEHFYNKRLVHASALSNKGEAIILSGLNKVGKSSIARYLFDNYNLEFLSDNFLLTDQQKVYSFPEKMRLSPDILKKFNINSKDTRYVYNKHHLTIPKNKIAIDSYPSHVFVISNNEKHFIKSINHENALSLLEGIHRYLKEFPEYSFYSLLQSFNFWKEKSNDLFNSNTNFYQLSFPLNWSIEKVSKNILECTSIT